MPYNPSLLLLKSGDPASDAFLHLAVGGPDVFVLGGSALLDVAFRVTADAGGAETDIALLWVGNEVHLQQKLEMSSFGCRSQKVRLKSIIFDLEIYLDERLEKGRVINKDRND